MAKLAVDEAIQGYACRYNKPFIRRDGSVAVLAPGCFSAYLAARRPTNFLLQHEPEQSIGSTSGDDLWLYDDGDTGLAFRFLCPPMPVRDVVAAGRFRSTSVGIETERETNHARDGETFAVIQQAALVEISLVERGAIANTSADVVRLADVGTLRQEAERGRLSVDGEFACLLNAIEDCSARLSSDRRDVTSAPNRSNRRRPAPIDMSAARDSFWYQPGAQAAAGLFLAEGVSSALAMGIPRLWRRQ